MEVQEVVEEEEEEEEAEGSNLGEKPDEDLKVEVAIEEDQDLNEEVNTGGREAVETVEQTGMYCGES